MTESGAPLAVSELPPIGAAVMCMGVFDGVHLGHRALLKATRAAATAQGAHAVALIFDPPPDELLHPGTVVPRLAPLEVNLERIERLGMDRAVPIRFDEPLRRLAAGEFLAALSPAIDVRGLAMSRRSAFGRNREGTVERMQALGRERGFGVSVVEAVEVDGDAVSSTRIRSEIARGDLAAAQRLGVVTYLQGTVVSGDRRGRQLGFPTANLRFDYLPAMPPNGVYAGRLARPVGSSQPGHPCLISIGTRPTFHEGGDVQVEVHLLDFDGDLYRRQLSVELLVRLRDEQRFPNADALVVQMRRDAAEGRAALGLT